MEVANIVEDVEHESTVSCSKLVDYKIVIWMVQELIICDQVSSESFAVERAKELGRRMPKLPSFIWVLGVQLIFKISVALPKQPMKLWFVSYIVEVERVTCEDYGLLGKVSITRIVEAV